VVSGCRARGISRVSHMRVCDHPPWGSASGSASGAGRGIGSARRLLFRSIPATSSQAAAPSPGDGGRCPPKPGDTGAGPRAALTEPLIVRPTSDRSATISSTEAGYRGHASAHQPVGRGALGGTPRLSCAPVLCRIRRSPTGARRATTMGGIKRNFAGGTLAMPVFRRSLSDACRRWPHHRR
jgi:hypothetical protein